MLIAISGAQGSGKSTIVENLSKMGHKTIERKTSRSILKDWGVSLSEVNNNHDLTVKFQDEILRRKFNDELYAVESSELYFTERSYADLFTYALISLGKDNQYSNWIDQYYETCMHYNQYYQHVYYIQSGVFSVEHDGVRGSNKHYSRMADLIMHDILKRTVLPGKLTTIDFNDLDQRIATILHQSRNM